MSGRSTLVQRPHQDGAPEPTDAVPRFAAAIVSPFTWRHVRAVSIIRYLVAAWLTFLASVLCAYGHWWGVFLYAAAAGVAALAFWMPRWKRALDASKLEAEEAERRVRSLQQSRSYAVEDAAARLRRIEQDLHDGAQAQMVAVVMKLGMARDRLGGPSGQAPDIGRALELIDAAQRGAVTAIDELRDLARGIHPPVLGDGLGAALATLAERSEVPVDLTLDLAERPSGAIEAIAYFCAAELLTNASKHSGARRVTLRADHLAGLVTIEVADDGQGGATLVAGGGLAGLVERVATVDGSLQLASPPGGGTVVSVELPSHA